MSTEAQAGHFPAVDWNGGAFPYRVGHRKLGMWLFIISDSLTFSALLMGYAYSARVKQLANAFSVLPEHRLFVGDDVLLTVVQFDNGVWCLRFE